MAVLIPALDEEQALPLVLADLARLGLRQVLVVDNGSRDGTVAVARGAGARVVSEPRRGYGQACQAGLATLAASPPDVVVFMDADRSDHPEDLPALLEPLQAGRADMVLGSRTLGRAEPGALGPHVRWGNRLAVALIRLITGARFTDLGPLRAIRWDALQALELGDPDYGWNVEMQVKAARRGMSWLEVPVRYRRRVGHSKISGTVGGTLRAGAKILWSVARHGLAPVPAAPD